MKGGVEEGGFVEVRPKGVNKGVCSMKVLKNFPNFAQSDKVEFALVLGDDHCDEPMLSVMRQIGRRVNDSRRVKKGDDPLPDLPASMTLVDVSGCDEYLAPHLEVFYLHCWQEAKCCCKLFARCQRGSRVVGRSREGFHTRSTILFLN